MRYIVPAMLLLLVTAACRGDFEGVEAHAAEPIGGGVVDSIFPIEEELRRFRADLPSEATALAEVALSREALVERFVAALARADLAELQSLALDRSEFAYLYYPFTRYTHPPYELSPGLLWFQMQNRSSRGLTRALNRLGGEPLRYLRHECNSVPVKEERNTLWPNCEVELRLPNGESHRGRLFGTVIEREGRFKFVSYSNGL
ncbi:hypothetical protein BH23GEM7_BH23GEM7_05410 [soil metagenome]